MNILIQKKNALIKNKAFTFGIITCGPYKGYSCEIIDILSTGLYHVRVSLMNSEQKADIDPINIIPHKDEKHKIEKALHELKLPGFIELLKTEAQIIMLSNVKNKIKNIDHLYELFYPTQKTVYTKKRIVIDEQLNTTREILVAEPYKERDPVTSNFLQLIFDKVKIQISIINTQLIKLDNKIDIIEETNDQTNEETNEKTNEDASGNYLDLENSLHKKSQEELFDFEDLLSRHHQQPEYIDPPNKNLFLRACEICGLNLDPEFVNSHSKIVKNYITFHFNQTIYYNEEHNSAIIVAYIFIYFNQLGKQILHEILDTLQIKVTSNNDAGSILNLMIYYYKK